MSVRRRGRNRRVKTCSVLGQNVMKIVVLVAVAAVMAMGYWYQDTRCSELTRLTIADKKKLTKLEKELIRERARFNSMKTPEKLRETLIRFGIQMAEPRPEQTIRMNKNCRPISGIGVTRAVARNGKGTSGCVAKQDKETTPEKPAKKKVRR